MNTLDEIFTKYNIVKFERSTFKGYEDYPAIGLFNKDGVEIAQIAIIVILLRNSLSRTSMKLTSRIG